MTEVLPWTIFFKSLPYELRTWTAGLSSPASPDRSNTYFTVSNSSFNMALSFSKNDARIEIWFSRDRRASRERFAAWLFFRR